MIGKPLVSIILATYNDSRYIAEAIESVCGQTYIHWEFIIVNDAYTDSTEQILKKIIKNDRRFIYIKNSQNLGIARAINKGVEVAKGKYIAKLDGDDYWSDSSKLEEQVNFLEKNPEYGLVGTHAMAVNEAGKSLYELSYPSEDEKIRNASLSHNCFLHSSVLIRKSILNKVGNYNTVHHFALDYDLFLKIGAISKVYNIPKTMIHYRMNPAGISQTKYWNQVSHTVDIISAYKGKYPGYYRGYFLWNLRRFYPLWLRGSVSRKIKKVQLFYRLSGA